MPEDVLRQVKFTFVSEISQVLKIMLAKPPKTLPKKKTPAPRKKTVRTGTAK